MKNDLISAIYKTLLYADLFCFPLTLEEIEKYLIWQSKKSPPDIEDIQKALKRSKFRKEGEFYYLNDKTIITKRKEKFAFSSEKNLIAKKISLTIGRIPTVKLIAISGASAIFNAEKEEDIDLFIITRKNTLWLTRLLVTLILDIKKIRRKPKSPIIKNKICTNMFLDETYLKMPIDKRNIYTAHEISQLKPIINRDMIIERFILANSWIRNYLPNSYLKIKKENKETTNLKNTDKAKLGHLIWDFIFATLDLLIKIPQVIYMSNKKTDETINKQMLAFHPGKYDQKVINLYNKRLENYPANMLK